MSADGFYVGAEWVRTNPHASTVAKRLRIDRVAGDRVYFTVIEAGGRRVGEQISFGKTTIREHYTHQESTPMNNAINIGDVFVGDHARTFAELRVLSKMQGYNARWRCIGTRHDGTTTPTTIYESTLLVRYTRKPTRDFNVDQLDYKRPHTTSGVPTKDLPLVPTRPIRESDAYRFLTTETATLIHVGDDGVRQAKTVSAKRDLLLNAQGGVMLLAVPGVYSMDTFFIDERAAALGTLGLRKHEPTPTPQPRTAVDGSQWVAA